MAKIITSFDIGIRNLAYCRMEYQPQQISGNQFKIHDWNVIDVLDTIADQSKTCQMTYKSGAKMGQACPNSAHYAVKGINGQSMSVCKVHSKAYPTDELKRTYTCANITLYELARLAIEQLDKIDFSDCQEVIFESQPKINPKMKNFSMLLFNYFVIRYIVEKPAHLQKIKEIRFVSSKNKLRVYDGPYIPCQLKSQYSRNKFFGKEYCKYIIRHNPTQLKFFNNFKKKDDLADSFLQGSYYLMIAHGSLSATINPTPILKKIKLKKNYLADPVEEGEEPEEDLEAEDDQEEELEAEGEIEEAEGDREGELKPKLKIKLKAVITGQQKLKQIRYSSTTKQYLHDMNLNKYKQLKSGYKPKDSAPKYTMSNIKWVMKDQKLLTAEAILAYTQKSSYFQRALTSYFGSIEKFLSILN